MDWSELWGGALGVVIGYTASEILSLIKGVRDRKAVRVSVQAEVDQNLVEVHSIISDIGDDPVDRNYEFGRRLRPAFSTVAWETHLIHSPSAFSDGEVRRLLEFYKTLATIWSVWDQYEEARKADTQSQVIIQSQPTEVHGRAKFTAPGTRLYHQTAKRLGNTLYSAIKQADEFDLRL